MPTKSWDSVVEFYQELYSHKGWEIYAKMEKLVNFLLASRNLSALHPFTSHQFLCLTFYKTYEEWKDKPSVTVEITGDYFKFTLVQPFGEGEIYREKTESIGCPVERLDLALQAFDDLTEKLQAVSFKPESA
jgi:hypothetical protein